MSHFERKVMQKLNIITGLPRSGSSVISSLLNQNPEIHSETNSDLYHLVEAVYKMPIQDIERKKDVIRSVIEGYFKNTNNKILIDRNINWIPMVPILNEVLGYEVKIVACVRNPAEIITSYERSRTKNPFKITEADIALKELSSLETRAFHYAKAEGPLGITHRNLKDFILKENNINKILFVNYDTFCANPKTQIKRIYNYLEVTPFEHNFENIEVVNDLIRPVLKKNVTTCVEYIGLDLYQQYNNQIFWDGLI